MPAASILVKHSPELENEPGSDLDLQALSRPEKSQGTSGLRQ
jgi:hypothetical protein